MECTPVLITERQQISNQASDRSAPEISLGRCSKQFEKAVFPVRSLTLRHSLTCAYLPSVCLLGLLLLQKGSKRKRTHVRPTHTLHWLPGPTCLSSMLVPRYLLAPHISHLGRFGESSGIPPFLPLLPLQVECKLHVGKNLILLKLNPKHREFCLP